MDNNFEFEVVKTVLGNDPWSLDVINRIKRRPSYKAIEYWNDIQGYSLNCPYYEWAVKKVERDGILFGHITEKDGIAKQTMNFYNLYSSIKQNGYLDNTELAYAEKNGFRHYYGAICLGVKDFGDFFIQDGAHRLAILIHLGAPIPIAIPNRLPEWVNIKKSLFAQWNDGKGLYQRIPHPDFDNWNFTDKKARDEIICDFIKQKSLGVNVLDLGICHGYTLYYLHENKCIASATGVEKDPIRFFIASRLLKKIGLKTLQKDIGDFIADADNSNRYSCVLMLSVIHHLFKEHGIQATQNILEKIGKITDFLIYEIPEDSESVYEWIPSGIGNPHEFIKNATGFKNDLELVGLNRFNRKTIVLFN